MSVTTPEFESQVASAASNETVNSFFKTWRDGDLKLRPAFQRNLVWNIRQQSFLVDSILRGLPVPEIYIQKETSAAGDEKTIVVDGQQRISTCIQFIRGRLRLDIDDELDERWRGRTFDELSDPLKKRFRSFELIVRKLPIADESTLREVFRRLNQTVEALEAQELRHAAFTGPFVQFVEQAAKQRILSEIGVFSPKDYLRRRNDEFIAEVAFAVVSNAFPNKKDGLNDFFLAYEKQGMPQSDLEQLEWRFGRVFEEMGSSASFLRKTRFRNKSDFYSLFVFMARKAESLPLGEGLRTIFISHVKDFSDRVSEIKRTESDGSSIDDIVATPIGREAVRYLRSVERAASDRLSRVRRQEALEGAMGFILDGADRADLGPADAAWRSAPDSDDEETDEILPEPEERQAVENSLLNDEPDLDA